MRVSNNNLLNAALAIVCMCFAVSASSCASEDVAVDRAVTIDSEDGWVKADSELGLDVDFDFSFDSVESDSEPASADVNVDYAAEVEIEVADDLEESVDEDSELEEVVEEELDDSVSFEYLFEENVELDSDIETESFVEESLDDSVDLDYVFDDAAELDSDIETESLVEESLDDSVDLDYVFDDASELDSAVETESFVEESLDDSVDLDCVFDDAAELDSVVETESFVEESLDDSVDLDFVFGETAELDSIVEAESAAEEAMEELSDLDYVFDDVADAEDYPENAIQVGEAGMNGEVVEVSESEDEIALVADELEDTAVLEETIEEIAEAVVEEAVEEIEEAAVEEIEETAVAEAAVEETEEAAVAEETVEEIEEAAVAEDAVEETEAESVAVEENVADDNVAEETPVEATAVSGSSAAPVCAPVAVTSEWIPVQTNAAYNENAQSVAPAAQPAQINLEDQVWIVSQNGSGFFCQVLENNAWRTTSEEEFFANDSDARPTIVWAHGFKTDINGAASAAYVFRATLERARQAAGKACPFRLVVWKWNSERATPRIRVDAKMKAAIADNEGASLARFVGRMNGSNSVAFVGFSFGARVVGSALQALATTRNAYMDSRTGRVSLVLISAACDYAAFDVNYAKGAAIPSHVLNVYNPSDYALHYYPSVSETGSQAQGVFPVSGNSFTGAFGRTYNLNVNYGVGKRHSFVDEIQSVQYNALVDALL